MDGEAVSLVSWVLCSMFLGVWQRPALLMGSSLTASALSASMAVCACNGMGLLALGTVAPVRFDTTIACCRNDASRRWLALWSGAQAALAGLLTVIALLREGVGRALVLRLEIVGAFAIVGYLASLREELLCHDPRADSAPKRLAALALYVWAALTFHVAARVEEHVHLRKDEDHDDDVPSSVEKAVWDKAAAAKAGLDAMKKGSKTV